ncbi:MAG: DUF4384 domain-containing protein [Candidatus Amulumruptor caecigallinarius]|nr:DUF4384 domain-containing protein [Candidatus Amulumruptor caecigallinarius]MCM1396372.1 DUF4384 domain-containing protein [Candidatus Amulumruptor caecigallinarius]MCM1453686.1 DUF4384 domain-containing protein [bacterium]
MLRFAVIMLMLWGMCVHVSARQTQSVTSEYLYQIPEDVSPEQAKAIALERAKIQAIADAYGTTVTQTSTTGVVIDNGVTSTRFTSVGGSELKGEWLMTDSEPTYEFMTEGASLAVRVRVRGTIAPLLTHKVPAVVRTFSNGIEPSNQTADFTDGDALFMSFNAPADGYLAVYLLDDTGSAYCLLPYQRQSEGTFATKANRDYVLFHRDYAAGGDAEAVDELVMSAEARRENNILVTIFSPNKFYKAPDSKSREELPRCLSHEEFERWLGSVRKRDADVSVTESMISVTPRQAR